MENLGQVEQSPNSDLRSVPNKKMSGPIVKVIQLLLIIIILAIGIGTGLVLSSRAKSQEISKKTLPDEQQNLTPAQKQNLQTVTRDSAEGVIQKNENFEQTAQGQWKLIRPGGDSQTAYLTSSYLNLDQYVGKKVKVYGETLGSDKVGWLIDVAKVDTVN